MSERVVFMGTPSFGVPALEQVVEDGYEIVAVYTQPDRPAGRGRAHVYSPSTDAVTPDEVMLLCLKALGGKAPISFQVDCNNLWANKRMPEMLEIIRTCDELKRRDYFPDTVCRELMEPFAEHVLEQTADGEWTVRPLQFGPARVVEAARR